MRTSGFSLLEIILAVGLLVAVVLFLVQGIITGGRLDPRFDRRYQKIRESANVMEQLKAVSFEALSAWDGMTFLGGLGGVEIVPVTATLCRVAVRVGDKDNPEVYFETLAAQ